MIITAMGSIDGLSMLGWDSIMRKLFIIRLLFLIRPRAYTKTLALGVEQRRVPIFVDLQGPSILKPGYEVQVQVETARKENVLLLPREAVQSIDQSHFRVMKIQKGRVKYQDVTLGLSNQEQVEIVSGLQEGDQVVLDATLQLSANTRSK